MSSFHFHLILFSLLASSVVLPSFSAAAELCNADDKRALLRIKKAFNDAYVLSSWDAATDCCEWNNVECDGTTHRIVTLNVPRGGLSGSIPSDVGDLPYLETIYLHKQPNLTGNIPRSLLKLKNLQYLTLSYNNLSGSIPGFLGDLTNLIFLDLSYNRLSGPIPSSLSNPPNLRSLRLDRNALTGSIPASLSHIQGSSPYLYLSHNQLTGEVPAALGDVDFTYIDLSWNQLSGNPSALFGLNKSAQQIYLARNMFEFNMSEMEPPQESLIALDLNHNKIFGGIPAAMTGVTYLQIFNVSYNRLCGEIPVGGRLQRFDSTAYFHNRCLCGTPLDSCK